MKRVALLGECLIELNGAPFGTLQQTFGGDSLNTALYLARLTQGTAQVKYVSALGIDALSNGMLERWTAEGIDTELVLRDPMRLPGMYLIQVDPRGERTFLYWRGQSAARHLLQHPEFDRIATKLAAVDLIFVTGISLAILPANDRAKLIALLKRLATNGVAIVLDTNYRPRLWSVDEARIAMQALLPSTRVVFATFDDEQQLWGDSTPQHAIERLHAAEARCVVLKVGAEGCLFSDNQPITNSVIRIPTLPVQNIIDTTAAGDAFNAAFLAGWLDGCSWEVCCRAGNAMAGKVIQHRGAIIPAAAIPPLSELFSI